MADYRTLKKNRELGWYNKANKLDAKKKPLKRKKTRSYNVSKRKKHFKDKFSRQDMDAPQPKTRFYPSRAVGYRTSAFRRPTYKDSSKPWRKVKSKLAAIEGGREPKFRDNWDRNFNDRDFLVRDRDVFKDEKVYRKMKRKRRRYRK